MCSEWFAPGGIELPATIELILSSLFVQKFIYALKVFALVMGHGRIIALRKLIWNIDKNNILGWEIDG